ncbi:MAG: hypothetical protein AAF614_17970 [Chloroflexota bacterium]
MAHFRNGRYPYHRGAILSHLITKPQDVTPDYLTQLFRQQDLLPMGSVSSIHPTQVDSDNFAAEYQLGLRYEGTGNLPLPQSLLLRISFAGKGWPNEPRFISDIVPIMRAQWPNRSLPFVTCYDAVFDAETKSSHLLREDLSETHFKASGDRKHYTYCREQIMDALALVHATWWEHPQLTTLVGPLVTANKLHSFLQTGQKNLPRLLETMDNALSVKQKTLLKLVPTKWPEQRQMRNLAGVGVTLAHHTASPEVVLFPHDPTTNHVRLTTWEPWRVDNGTIDTAYYMAFWWSKAERDAWERPLLHHYYRQLITYGVENYSWDDCLYDYRASIFRLMLQLIQSWKPIYQNNWYWEAMMRGLAAFEDWDCRELLS